MNSKRRGQIVVLFADISNSSRLYRELDDTIATAAVANILAHLAVSVRSEAGEVVDQIGDELMCSFPHSTAAIRCAAEMQFAARKFAEEHRVVGEIAIRIGLHCGEGSAQEGKPVGDPVYIAKRLTDQAKPGQILLSEQSMTDYDDGLVEFRFVEEVMLKGQTEQTRIYELVWDDGDATEMAKYEEAATASAAISLELLTPDAFPHNIATDESITLGRVSPASLVMDHTTVSRLHARIEGRKGRFVLIDVSTNGTFIQSFAETEPLFVRRDEISLNGVGMIGLGSAPSPGAPHTVQYRCITE